MRIADGGYEAVAVGLMHAYANDIHECMVADALRRAAPDLAVSISSVVSPQMRELPRFNTVIANAYVQPLGLRLSRAAGGGASAAAGIDAPVFLMHSGGGLVSVETAIDQPVRLLESGPAGGAIYAAGVARAHGLDKALSFDMGGTTAKICLIEDGTPKTANTFEVARTYRFKKGLGHADLHACRRDGRDRRGRRVHRMDRRDGADCASGRNRRGRNPGRPATGVAARRLP
jgi:N-methylhydantoinase A